MKIELETTVTCVDGVFGRLEDVVVDPRTRRVTHLVLKPEAENDRVRLTPIQGVHNGGGSGGLTLDWTVAKLIETESVQESAYVRMGELVGGGSDWSVGIQEMYSLPEYGSLGPEILGTGTTMEYDQHVAVSYHRIPLGGVEIRRASPVTSSDGHHLGHVIGFIVDDEAVITELILEHGHMWTKRMVAIPGSAIERFQTDELALSLTQDRVAGLKSLPGHRRWG
jgi:sporulation protein YlmC with PRC-barrel domain